MSETETEALIEDAREMYDVASAKLGRWEYGCPPDQQSERETWRKAYVQARKARVRLGDIPPLAPAADA